jgi:site-specific recombinase XerD
MVNHPLKEWIKSAGITRRITFHSMRHSFATLLAANGVDILTISRMLTHKSVINTQIYAKVVDERAREASEVISLK